MWLLILAFWTLPVFPDDSDVQVVVNNNVDQGLLSLTTVRAIFGMRLRAWPDGTPIRVFVLYDSHPLHTAFCKQVLNIFPHQLRLAWDRLVFSGTGQAPYKVNTETQMRRRVAATPGAIGYLDEAMINDTVHVSAIE